MCLSSCCLCSPALFLPHSFRKPWRRPEPRETWSKHPLDFHTLLSSAHTKQKAFAANYSLKSWDLKITTIFVKREKNGGKAPPGGTARGLRNSATKWRRVPEGGERGRGSQGTLCLWGPPALAKRPERGGPASPQALPQGRGRGAGQRLTQGRRSQAPLTAGRCPSAPATPRGAAPASRAPQPRRRCGEGGRCRAPCRGCWEPGLVGQARSSFGGGEKGLSPFTQRAYCQRPRRSALPGTPRRGVGALQTRLPE